MMRNQRYRKILFALSLFSLMVGLTLSYSGPVMAAGTTNLIAPANLASDTAFYTWAKNYSGTKPFYAYSKTGATDMTLLFPYASSPSITPAFRNDLVSLVTGTDYGSGAPTTGVKATCTYDVLTTIAVTARSYKRTCHISKKISPNTTVVYYISDVDAGGDSVSQDLFIGGLQVGGVYVSNNTLLFKSADGTQQVIPDVTASPNILSAHKTCKSPSASTGENVERCALGVVATSDSNGLVSIDWINRSSKDTKAEFSFDFPYTNEYRTLTFDPAGGTIDDIDLNGNGVVGEGIGPGKDNNLNRHYTNTLWEHQSGTNRLREYKYNDKVGYYPIPLKTGCTFNGWYDGATNRHLGGDSVATDRFNLVNDTTLTASWTCATWTMSGRTAITNTITGTAIANNAAVTPGQRVTFTHYVKNNGPNTTGQDIWADTVTSTSSGAPAATGMAAFAGHNFGTFTAGQEKSTGTAVNGTVEQFLNNITIPNNALNGAQYCEYVRYQWAAWNNSALTNGSPAPACVIVSYAYLLNPTVGVQPGITTLIGQDVTFSYAVSANTPYAPNPFTWQIRQTVTAPNGNVTSSTIQTGNASPGPGMNNTPYVPRAPDTISTSSYPVGTKICRYLQVNSSTQNPNVPVENGNCTTIVASPYVTIVGGNTWAGGSTTSPYTGSGTITGSATSSVGFGSFGEYGIFATGPISYFGSAGRLGSGTTGMVDGTRLTFASTGSLGSFTNSHKITDLTSRCSGAMTSSVTIDAAYLATLNLQANTSNNHRVICGNVVTIATNITYATTGATTFGQLPSLTVIANTIQVNGRDATNTPITQIAGNFYAVNKFITCTEGPTSVAENATKSSAISTTGACSGQLTINGTVTVAGQTANALVLNRSYGGDAPNKPAEIIKMRPESFLTPFEAGTNTSLLTTVSEKELPARY